MCYPLPGPRCSPHVKAHYAAATDKAAATRTEYERVLHKAQDQQMATGSVSQPVRQQVLAAEIAFKQAEAKKRLTLKEFKATPDGQRMLRRAIDHATATGHTVQAQKLAHELAVAEATRDDAFAAYRREFGTPGKAKVGRTSTSENPEVAELWKINKTLKPGKFNPDIGATDYDGFAAMRDRREAAQWEARYWDAVNNGRDVPDSVVERLRSSALNGKRGVPTIDSATADKALAAAFA